MKYKQFGKYTAIFNPKRIDNIRDMAFAYIGKKITVYQAGRVDEGTYKGQLRFDIRDDPEWQDIGTWIPECDLENITPID